MGIKSQTVVVNDILGGHREISEYLLSTHTVSLCDNAASKVLRDCNLETIQWCLDKSLIIPSVYLIIACINANAPSQLQKLKGVVTWDHFHIAIRALSYDCLKVLCRASTRWNPRMCVKYLQKRVSASFNIWTPRIRESFLRCLASPRRVQEIRVGSLLLDWCASRNIPVRRWSSQSTLQQVVFTGDVDQYGSACRRRPSFQRACFGCFYQLHGLHCDYSPRENSTGIVPRRLGWLCNPSHLCWCGVKLDRRHSI